MLILPLSVALYKLKNFIDSSVHDSDGPLMPALFLGHGSPMNAIEENEFVEGFRTVARNLPKPKAILCISAHWETKGTMVTAMEMPKTIHDFGGFPPALYQVQYPAKGSPKFAEEVKQTISKTEILLDHSWGLDHGAWSVVKHLYPEADIPIIQMSLDYTKDPNYHFDLATQLKVFRRQGVLIVGSGNMVHNLGLMAWDKLNSNDFAFDWALEAKHKLNMFIIDNDIKSIINYKSHGKAFELAIPSPEHYLPLIYTLALKADYENPILFNDKAVAGSITMTSVRLG